MNEASSVGIAFDGVAGSAIIHLSGELDFPDADRVERCLIEASGPTIVADLSRLTFIGSAGLRALLRAKRAIEQRGGRLVVRSPHHNVVRTIELVGLRELLLDLSSEAG